MENTKLEATEEQLAFCSKVEKGEPCFLSARAGTGKTSTIKMVFDKLGNIDCTVIAFNKKNQEDLAKALGVKVKVSTLHSLGYKALRNYMPGLELDNSKLFELTKLAGLKGKARNKFSDTMRLVSSAKNWGLIPKRPNGKPNKFKAGLVPDTPETWLKLQEHFELWEADLEAARSILQESNELFLKDRTIDFDDMVYLPVALGLKVFTTAKMIVDEAQDLSPLNLKMLSTSPAKIWYVGDPYQCIYSWRGASEDVVESIGLPELPLTTCWRCSTEVIKFAQRWVEDIRARDQAPSGTVQWLTWMPDWDKHKPGTILGRRNSALVSIAINLQKSGKQVCIIGKDFAKTLTDILDTFKGNTQKRLLEECKAWLDKMSDKFPHRAGEFEDYATCLTYLIQENHGTAAIARAILKLFTDKPLANAWTLSTIHKAKGMEWDTVWVLWWEGKNLEQPWIRKEDRNLRYVAVTRAKQDLRIIDELAWNPKHQQEKDWRDLYD